jgi:hypothetical protein
VKVEIFTLCEFANADPASGKINIIGTFDHIGGFQTPIVFPLCVVAIRMRFGVVENGMKKVRLSFIDADGAPVMPTIEVPLNVQIAAGESTTTAPCVVIMQQIKLPHFGEYSISLAIDSNEVAAIPLIAKQVLLPPMPGRPAPSQET